MFKQFISFIKGIFSGKKEVHEPTFTEIINNHVKESDLKELFGEKTNDSEIWVPMGQKSIIEETPTKVEEPVEVKQEESPVTKPKRKYTRRKKTNSTPNSNSSTEEKPKRKYTRRSAPKKSD